MSKIGRDFPNSLHSRKGLVLELKAVEKYPRTFLESELSYQVGFALHLLATSYLKTKQYQEARRNYQQALEISIEFGDRFGSASTYHQLGWVAQELREFEEARRNYQQALEISIEFGDRFGSAKPYHNLGLLAEAQENYAEARANLHKALEIYVEYKDDYWAANAREALERLPE